MEQIIEYIKPELLVLSVALYFLGRAFEKTGWLSGRYLPLVLSGIGILLSAVWVLANSSLQSFQEKAMALFTAVVQGILVSGLAVWILYRRSGEEEKK